MGDHMLRKMLADKRDGKALSSDDIGHFVDAVKKSIRNKHNTSTNGTPVADRCQIGAMLMAIYINGLNAYETNQLTLKMRDSGRVFEWSETHQPRIVDKHSTGGVGDKISLILTPALAACNLLVPMVSGRSLGHTGGTLNKLEAIQQFSVNQSDAEIKRAIDTVGCCIVSQTEDCVPADKVLYECRDLTSTVSYPPLIIASIASKKLSENPSALVYDVKFGRGSLFKSEEEALETAKGLVKASKPVKAVALLTCMEAPLGRAVGDCLEVLEAVECLKGNGPHDIIQLVEALGGELLHLTHSDVNNNISKTLKNGTALKKFHDMLIQQNTDKEIAKELCYGEPTKALKSHIRTYISEIIYSGKKGYISRIDALVLGNIWKEEYSNSLHNPGVGFILVKCLGDMIEPGDVWLKFHHQCEKISDDQKLLLSNAIEVSASQRVPMKLIQKRVYLKDDLIVVEDY